MKKTKFIFLFLLFNYFLSYHFLIFAQKNDVFSEDSLKIENLHQECKKIDMQSGQFNPEQIRKYANEALQIAKKNNYTNGKGTSHYFLGMVNEAEKKFDESEKNYLQWIKSHEIKKSKIPLSVAYIKISNFYFEQEKYKKGKKYFEKALKHTFEIDKTNKYLLKFSKEQIRNEKDKKEKDFERILF